VEVVTPTAGDPSGLLSASALELGLAGGDFPPLVNLPGVTPANLTQLFPTVSPGSNASGLSSQPGGRRSRHVDAVAAAAVLPQNSLLVSGQIVGLAVLAGAIAFAFVRFSLRPTQPTGGEKPG
jgi:hypothetical protein